MLSWWFVGDVGEIGLKLNDAAYIPAVMVSETLGTLLLVFIYLT